MLKMKIWFDLSNSPHINLFHDLIKDLEKSGHEVIITCRPLANTIDLLEQKKMKYKIVGDHYGKKFYKKIFGYPVRVVQLWKYLKKLKPDLAVSQSSFHSPVVARLLRIPSIYTNDNEHAMGNIPAFIFATKIFIPENLSIKKVIKQGAAKRKVTQYPGVKEGIYLWRLEKEIYEKRKNKGSEIKIYVRPEPLTAQYYKAGINFLDEALVKLQNKYSVTVLPRDRTQMAHYKQSKFSSINVPEKPLHFMEIAVDCSLFIGAGGSMTRELAILSIPTISVYQADLLEVDNYLIEKQLMHYEPEVTTEMIDKYVTLLENSDPDKELLIKGQKAYEFIKTEILKFNKK
jgi:predicted glycosyltransferase